MKRTLLEQANVVVYTAVPCLALWVRRLAPCLGLVSLVVVFVSGVVSKFAAMSLPEATMQVNFGPGWRHTMYGAAETNRLEFERMQAILKQIEGHTADGASTQNRETTE